MKRLFRNRPVVVIAVLAALLPALRPAALGAAPVPPRLSAAASPADADSSAAGLAALLENAGCSPEHAAAVIETLSPAQREQLARDGSLVAAGGSGLGLLLIVAVIVGITALVLRETGHQLRVETKAGR